MIILPVKPLEIDTLINPHGNSLTRRPCDKQVYSSEEIAKKTAAAFLRLGFLSEAHVERCFKCHMIHIREVRK